MHKPSNLVPETRSGACSGVIRFSMGLPYTTSDFRCLPGFVITLCYFSTLYVNMSNGLSTVARHIIRFSMGLP